MRRRTNLWYDAICEHLRTAGGPLTVGEILGRLKASGFQHTSARPRQTLGGRLAELVSMNRLERVGPATYRLATLHAATEQPQSEGSP